MTIKEFIEAAIEGGFENEYINSARMLFPTGIRVSVNGFGNVRLDDSGGLGRDIFFRVEEIIMKPEAWKVVGKVKGWDDGETMYDVTGDAGFTTPYENVDYQGPEWGWRMHLMVQHLVERKTLEEYIATL